MENAIELTQLTKTYPGFTLDKLTLSLPKGSILGLIGENGAGKSTTIKSILGLICPNSGSIRILGGSPTDPAIQQRIGIVLDECPFHDVLNPLDVDRILSHTYTGWDSALFQRYLEQFKLPSKKKLKEFSKGMKTKLCIAAALAHRPELLILDEATSGLDPVVRDEILDEFLALIQDEKKAVLISSHITSDLEKIADYIAYLHKGKLYLSGEKDELLATHGRLVCTAADLAQVDPAFLLGQRKNDHQCEALICRKREFQARYPRLAVDPVSLEDLMVFTVRGNAQ